MVQLAEEIPNEQIATALQDFSEWVNLHPERTFGDYLKDRPSAMLATLLQTISGTTAQTGAAHLVAHAANAASKISDKLANASEAQRDKTILDAHEKAAAESTYRKRDPEGYAALIGYVAGENGIDQVYVPGEAIKAYQQSDAYDQFEDPFAPYQAQIEEAAATGGDVVLPAGFALGTLPGTAAWTAIKDDMRFQPGGMSAREAEELNGRLDDVVKELSDQSAAQAEATASEQDARAALVERVRQELQNAGFTPANAALQAELIAQRASVRAARLGRQMQPGDFDTRIVSVLPPALAQMQQADRLDLVINAMRKGGDATKQDGKSLLDFIAARGGIEDRGGDIAAMGGDKWHRGKVGRKKLLKDFEEAQGNLIGSSGANPNSLRNTLDAAISEGYFPELLARRENGEAIDDRELLDAIGQELSGTPVYPEAAKVDDVRLAADELRQMLEDSGRDPSGMSDAEVRKAVAALVEESRGAAGRGFDQSLNEGPRGRITLPAGGFGTGPSTIELFQSRNPSTLLHELSHQWLEELRYDAELPDAPEQLKTDWQTVQNWFKANGHEVIDGFIPTEAHELWARGGERYLMEGKAPSSALQRLFETFRGWLLNFYRTVDALRAPITPEIREVFDRLLATDDELQQQREAQAMNPLFKDAASAGMTGPEYEAYTRQVLGARDEAQATLLAKTMAAIKRRATKAYNDERKGVVADEAARLDDSPVLKSLRLMKDTPLSLEWLQDRMGQDVTDLLPKRVPPIWKEGGANPDSIAEMAGFESGQQMIEVLIGA
ncbi:MAG: acetyltransferase, partial [Proteobacteria bacterium]|nr:acetyltransferase [Pseudomonadota bacterium]